MVLKKSVFKAYDIRGVYPVDLDEETAYLVGRAFVDFLKCRMVIVGRDMRKSSDGLFKELARGIVDQGADVIDLGMCTTPMLSFAVAKFNYDSGIMISASHNPGQYNAFKLIMKNAEQMSVETGINEIFDLCKENNFKTGKKGQIIKKEVLTDYEDHVLSFGKNINQGDKNLKVVVDYGNGVGSISGKPIFSKLHIEVIPMYENPDGSFPNHEANPVKYETLKELQMRIIAEKADLGIAFDGDGDRSIILDKKGNIISPDLLLGILAEDKLKAEQGGKVYYDLRFSKAIKETIIANGGEPIMMRVGNPFYKSALIHHGGILAGEFSGHIMYKDNFCIDDGLFAAVKLMDLVSKTGKEVSMLVKPLQKYYQSEEINFEVHDSKIMLDKIKKKYYDGEISDMDGILVEYDIWWFSIRASNTEPIVRLRLEADTKELLLEKRKELLDFIKAK
jgi:phosphomannomutase